MKSSQKKLYDLYRHSYDKNKENVYKRKVLWDAISDNRQKVSSPESDKNELSLFFFLIANTVFLIVFHISDHFFI